MTAVLAPETPGVALREARERAGVRQAELARYMGVDRRQVHLWESDQRKIPPAKLAEAHRVLVSSDTPAARLIAAALAAGSEGLTAAEARRASPALPPACLARLTAPGGPLKRRQIIRIDARGRPRRAKILVLTETAPATQLSGRLLRHARQQAELSIAELAAEIGCAPQQISSWETGHRPVPDRYQQQLRQALGRRIDLATFQLPPPATPAITAQQTYGLRLLLGLNRDQLAKRMGVTIVALGQWERDERPVPPARATELLTLASEVTSQGVKDARKASGLGLNECAHAAGMPQSDLSRWEQGKRGAPAIETLLNVADAIAQADRNPRPLPRETAWQQLRPVLKEAGAAGIDMTRLLAAAERGRRGQQATGVTPELRRAELLRRERLGHVEKFGHEVATRAGGRRFPMRYRLSGLVPPIPPMSAEELRQRMVANDVRGATLARALGVSNASITLWKRRRAPLPGAWAGPIRKLLPRTEVPNPQRQALQRILAAVTAHPNEARGVITAAGYGHDNPAARHALAELERTGRIHRSYAGAGPGSRRAVYRPGPGPRPVTGAQVRTERRRHGLSQTALAVRLGVTPSSVSGWEAHGDATIPTCRWGAVQAALRA